MSTGQPEQAVEYWKHQAESFDAIYSGEKSALGRGLDRWLRADIYERFEWTMEQSGDVSGRTVCDLGCGSGRYLIGYAKAGAARVVGIDSAEEMIDKAREVVAEAGVADRCELRVGNIADLPASEDFEITIAIGVFDYVADPQPFLQRIRAITRDRFIATYPRRWTWRMPVRKARLSMVGCPVYFFTPQEVREDLESTGFEVEQLERVGEIYCVLARPKTG